MNSDLSNPLEEGLEDQQRMLCEQNGLEYVRADMNSILGFAVATEGKLPINGLRHQQEGGTSGWYVWCGEHLSQAPDFFSPIHAHHLLHRCKEAVRFLGLPPGSRFLTAGDYVDIWFDESLLLTETEGRNRDGETEKPGQNGETGWPAP